MYVEQFYKEGDRWIFAVYEGESAMHLKVLDVAIATEDLYRRVDFEL